MSLFYMAISFASRPNSVGQASHPRIHAALNFVPNLFGGIPDEVRPSISSTFGIYKGVLKEHALFGTGPNRFSEGWVKNRPAELNQTAYGDTDFTFGFGYIPTLMTSTGIVGSIALICLFVLAMCQAVYLILRSRDDYDRVLSFGTIYLILMSLLYVPALPLILIMFVGMGAVASRGKNTTITLQNNVFNAVVLKALIALAITLFAIIGTILIKEYRAARYFMQASLAVSQDKNVASAEALLGKTVKLHPTDIYYRGVSELLALKAQVIANQNSKDGKISEEARNVALQTYESSEAAAEKAISLNPTNYSNYLFAGSVFAADPSKLEKAENIYNQALKYSPNNPNVYYGIARIRAQKGDIDGVKYNLQKAIETRPVFTDALIAGAQVKASEKDLRGALDFLAQAYRSNPSRVDLLLIIAQVQYLQLNDINAAIVTLEFAVGNNPNYADGRFGLATLYAKQKNFADAAKLLVGIKTDDEKTKQMLDEYIAKLNAGVDPFVSVTKPKTEATATSTKATSTKTAVKKK